MKKKEGSGDEAQRGGYRSGQPISPERVRSGKRRGEHVRERQPRNAELVESGSEVVDQAASDVQMGFGIAEVVQPTMCGEIPDGQRADDGRRGKG